MSDTRLPESKCTACGYLTDTATCPSDDNAVPEEGAITVCIRCGHMMAYDAELRLRDLTDEEMHEVAGNEDILRIQEARGEFFK